jgi:putative transposase
MKERRNQPQHSPCANPELIADGPNQGWSWCITNLAYFCLYVIHDIFSRYVVEWMVTPREREVWTKRVIEQSFGKQRITQGQLIIHSDREPSMTSKSVALFLADLGITKSLPRPHVSNGNPYSESQFKTLKDRSELPERFGCIEDIRSGCKNFFHRYAAEHHLSGIGSLTPEDVRYGRAQQIYQRTAVLNAVFLKHPERFKGRMPKPMVWPFSHLSGSTNRHFPRTTRRCTKFLPEVSHFHWRVPVIQNNP